MHLSLPPILASGLFALATSSALASSLDMSRVRTVAQFGDYNQASNLLGVNGQLLIPDTESDVLMVRGLAGAPSFDIPLSITRAMFVVPIGNNKYVLSDAYEDKLAAVDVTARRELNNYSYQSHFGPWHLAFYNGTIYGSDKGDRLINRFNPTARRQLPDYDAGSGPSYMVAARNQLFVAEEGAPSAPGDDNIAWYDLTTNTLAGRDHLDGSLNEMAAWGDGGVCITLSFSNKLQCGYPDRHEWLYGETGIAPWGVVAGDGQIWVLTRGEDNIEEAMVIAYAPRGDHLERLAAWKLRGIPGLRLPRSLGYDATTRTLLVRGMGSVIAIPVVD